MNNFNFTALEGNLVKDPEVSTSKNGSAYCNFTIGSNRSYKNKEGEQVDEASFFDVTTWTKLAEICGKYLKKGSRVLVAGTLQKNTWRDANDKYQSRVYLKGREVNFLSPKT